MDYKDEAMKFINKALEYYNVKKYSLTIPLIEKAVSIASKCDDVFFQMDCRFFLIDSYVYCEEIMKAYINFVWCNNQMKKGYKNEKVMYNIMWHYKYLSGSLYDFVSIPKEKLNEFFEDMKQIFIENNVSLKCYYSSRMDACINGIDDGTPLKEYHRKYLTTPKDDRYEDCIACVTNDKVDYYLSLGDYERALKEAENIINGKYKCLEIPHRTFAELILPLYSLGKYELADTLHRRGIRLVNGKKEFINCISKHIMYLSLTNIEKGIKVFENNYQNSLQRTISDGDKLLFNTGAFILFSKLYKKNVKIIKMKIPKFAPIYSENEYSTNKLKLFFGSEAKKLMIAFDERNRNDVISNDIKKYLQICNCECF